MRTWLPVTPTGLLAAVGLGCMLPPLWTLTADSADLEAGFAEAGVRWEDTGVTLRIGFYDWGLVTSGATAIAVTLAVRGADRTLWAAAAATMLCTLALSAATALQPAPSREVTGPLSRRLRLEDLDAGGGFDVGYGAGLIVALVAMVGVLGVAVWQYAALRPRTAPVLEYPY
jgi:hypothetical protein